MRKGAVSLCMIVKNEEANLMRCLNSIKNYVDEIIIVDTGSTDNTVKIAEEVGALVINEPWEDNFAQARNAGLEYASGDWILFLDADEEVLPKNLHYLKNLQSSTVDGYFIEILNISEQGDIKQRALRLFKNHAQHRFEGVLHEQIIKSIQQRNPHTKFSILDMTIKHFGYQNELIKNKDKINRNLSILKKELNKGIEDPFLLYNIGTEYLRLGEFSNAIYYFTRAENLVKPELSYAHLLGKKKIQALIENREYNLALKCIDKYIGSYPDYTDLYFLKAFIKYIKGNFAESLQLYKKCLELGSAPELYVSEAGVGSYKAESAVKHIAPMVERLQNNATPKPGLSLCMIVKNEEKNLARCLKSVVGIADEMIIVDTGSQDRTIEIAKAYGADVYYFPWLGDFSIARNFSLSIAQHEWILVLDADEALRVQEHSIIKKYISNNNSVHGFLVKLVNYFSDLDPDDYVIDAVCRLFKNKKDYRFASSLHEEISQSISKHNGIDSIKPLEMHIDHIGYIQKQNINRKNIRNTKIIGSHLKQHPDDPYAIYAYGTELFQQEDYQGALEQYLRIIDLIKSNEILADVYFKIIICYIELKKYRSAWPVLRRGQQLFSDFTSLLYLQGILEYRQGKLVQACKCWQDALVNGDPPWYRYTYPHGIATFRSAAALADCYVELNQLNKAETLLKKQLQKGRGIRTLLLPFCRTLLKKYDKKKCLNQINQQFQPFTFQRAFCLADSFNQLNQPEFVHLFLKQARELIKENPRESHFLQLIGIQLGLAGKYCRRGCEVSETNSNINKVCKMINSFV